MRDVRDYLEERLLVSMGRRCRAVLPSANEPWGWGTVAPGAGRPWGWLHWTKGTMLIETQSPGTLQTAKVLRKEGKIK